MRIVCLLLPPTTDLQRILAVSYSHSATGSRVDLPSLLVPLLALEESRSRSVMPPDRAFCFSRVYSSGSVYSVKGTTLFALAPFGVVANIDNRIVHLCACLLC